MTQFKEGDKVDFEHVGRDLTGTIIEVMADGKVRVKDERGYMYRYQPENVRPAGAPKVTSTPDSSNSNTNNQTNNTMAKKKNAEKKPAKATAPKAEKTNGNGKAEVVAASNPALDADKKKIAALTCKKHQRIWLLHALGLDKAEVMQLAGCNAGEISNVRKSYGESPEKVRAAEALLA